MRIDRRILGWGAFLITVGAVPLAVGAHAIPDDIHWLNFWPLLLVGWGVGIILGRTRAAALGSLIVALTFGLFVGGTLARGGIVGLAGCAGGSGGTAFASASGTFSGPSAHVTLEQGCGDLTVMTASGSNWTLAGTNRDGRSPQVEAAGDRLSVRSAERFGFFGFGDVGERWDVTLPTGPTLDLSATVNAGTGRLTLPGAHIGTLSLTLNAGETRIDLGGATIAGLSATVNAGAGRIVLPDGYMEGSIRVNAGSVSLCAPPSAGLRLTTNDSIAAGNNFATKGLTRQGSTWETAGFAAATTKIQLSLSANAGGFTLNPEEGCR